MLTLTESAVTRVQELLAEEEDKNTRLRVFVQGGGCSGMQYGFAFETDPKNDDDFEVDAGSGVVLLVDSMSAQYLQNAKIDYKEDLMGANFSIDNPNAETTCGCGSSFSPH